MSKQELLIMVSGSILLFSYGLLWVITDPLFWSAYAK